MTYPLQNWDILINTTINPGNLKQFLVTEDSLRVFIEQSDAEKEKLRIRLMQDFYARAEQKKMKFDIQFNQTILIKLLDRLYNYNKTPGLNSPVIKLYETIANHVSFILDFIEEYFGKYFDRTENVPAPYLEISKKEICKSLREIQNIFTKRPELDQHLSAIITNSFLGFCKDEEVHLTYNDLIYQKELSRELINLSNLPQEVGMNELLIDILIYMNFNDPDFILFCLSHVTEEINSLRTNKKKIEKIVNYKKQLGLVQLRASAGLHPNFLSTKETLITAFEKEIEYLNGNQNDDLENRGNSASSIEFVNVPFKGAEIYLLHKSFIDSGGAPNEIYKTLLEKTASRLSNKTQKGFRAESMVKYSDKVDPQCKETVKRFLQKMIRNIESYD